MDTNRISFQLLEILAPVLLASLTWIAAKLAQLIRIRVHNERLAGVLAQVNDAVLTAVKDLQQSTVKQLKAANADGKITEAEQQQLKRAALESIKASLGAQGRAAVTKSLGIEGADLEGMLSSKVEAAVYDLRRASAIATTATNAAATSVAAPTTATTSAATTSAAAPEAQEAPAPQQAAA